MRNQFLILICFGITVACWFELPGNVNGADGPKRVLLLGQKPDGHAKTTHEYMAGQRLLLELLARVEGIEVEVVQADSPWEEGPEQLESADVVVLYVSEGARWIHEDPRRQAAFAKFASRGGGLVAYHWAVGTRTVEPIEPFLRLFGACHGGPDRRVEFHDVKLTPADEDHPILNGFQPVKLRDEWYFKLKRLEGIQNLTPLLTVEIEGQDEMVAWAWERPDGGRSFGFTGLHFHETWKQESYRRLIAQAVLWSLEHSIPEEGIDVDVAEHFFELQTDTQR